MYRVELPCSSAAGTTEDDSWPEDRTQDVHTGESAQKKTATANKAKSEVTVTIAVDQANFSAAISLRPQAAGHLVLHEEKANNGGKRYPAPALSVPELSLRPAVLEETLNRQSFPSSSSLDSSC